MITDKFQSRISRLQATLDLVHADAMDLAGACGGGNGSTGNESVDTIEAAAAGIETAQRLLELALLRCLSVGGGFAP